MATDRLRRKLRDVDPSTYSANFCIFGTPLPDLNSSKKDANELKPIWQQEARDAQGRRRFHGAFTGGFSAGYFNTVGSKEGWTPGSFRSSRSDKKDGDGNAARREGVGSRSEDFMDEEDLEDWKAAQHVSTSTNPSFRGGAATEAVAGLRGQPQASIHTDPLASVLFRNAQTPESLGFKLLRRMGWKEGQGLGPRVDARKKARLLSLISNDATIATSSKITLEDMKHLYAPPPTPFIRSTDQRGSKRGLGAEDAPTLSQVLSKEYGPSSAKEAHQDRQAAVASEDVWPSDGRPVLTGFRLASIPAEPSPKFEPEQVPEGWQPDPSRVWSLSTTYSKQQPTMDPKTRGELLGEAKIPGPPPSIAAFLSIKAQERLAATTANALLPSNSAPLASRPQEIDVPRLSVETARAALQGHAPFSRTDAAKQSRYETYLTSQFDATAALPVPHDLTAEQYNQELQEFAKAASMFRPMSSAIASRFTTASAAVMEHETRATSATPGLRHPTTSTKKDAEHSELDPLPELQSEKVLTVAQQAAKIGNFGHLTRKVEPWAPERLLCKRFGVAEPAISRKRKEKQDVRQTTRPGEEDDDLDPFYGSTQSSKSEAKSSSSSGIRVDQHWEQNKEQLMALASAPTPLSLDAAGSSFPHTPAPSSEHTPNGDESAVGIGDDDRQGKDTLTYVKPSIDVYKAIFESDEEGSDSEGSRSKGSSAKPKMQDPSSGTGVVFQARSKRKEPHSDVDKPVAPKRKKEKGSNLKKALLTFDMDDDGGDSVQKPRKEKTAKKSLLTFDEPGDLAEGQEAASDETMKGRMKGRMRAADLF